MLIYCGIRSVLSDNSGIITLAQFALNSTYSICLLHLCITDKSTMLLIIVFWDMMTYSLVDGYHCFRVTYAFTII
jgi:hypothetical protein